MFFIHFLFFVSFVFFVVQASDFMVFIRGKNSVFLSRQGAVADVGAVIGVAEADLRQPAV